MAPSKKPASQATNAEFPKSVSIAFAKAHYPPWSPASARTRAPITVLRRGVPVAQIVPLSDAPPSLFGSMRGTVQVLGDIVGPTGVEWTLRR